MHYICHSVLLFSEIFGADTAMAASCLASDLVPTSRSGPHAISEVRIAFGMPFSGATYKPAGQKDSEIKR